ncbi:MAG: CcoQ/FixQ family Cbb3-type cytochrome c oxidase assembly chaperone [Saprospiraceae bacterium]|nr:CcoQ/FixQ family Cbb3-type cytochrome c oxidase assembly chaperone [Saprospiraceae bacterium]
MKFQHYLERISGIQIFPFISLLIFVCFFVGVSYWAFKIHKSKIKEYENIPFN